MLYVQLSSSHSYKLQYIALNRRIRMEPSSQTPLSQVSNHDETPNNNQAGSLAIRHLRSHDFPHIYDMYNNPETKYLWLPDEEPVNFEQFKSRLERRISHRWDHFYVFDLSGANQIVGFAYCYQSSRNNKTAYLCIYIDKPFMSSHISLKACYLYLSYLFDQCKYRKLFAEVFAYNKQCADLLPKLQFEKEGCLKAYQLWNAHYWDQLIFSLTASTYNQLKKKYQPILKRPSWKIRTN